MYRPATSSRVRLPASSRARKSWLDGKRWRMRRGDVKTHECEKVDVVFAILSVAGAIEACAAHGDAATVETLASYYALVDNAIRRASGRVVKVIGDGVIVTF